MLARVVALLLAPVAALWARRRERAILRDGRPLDERELDDARRAGVAAPERVRIAVADVVPPKLHPLLDRIGRRLGLVSPFTSGMSLRYGIYIRAGHGDCRELLAHELAHTAQYERLGGLWPFMVGYLYECLSVGYPNGPLEREAADVSCRICGSADESTSRT
jgi:hypothetical protein